MSNWINRNFDIDLWIRLATDDPYKFEFQRQQWLQDTIDEAKPEQQARLKGLLWEMNMDLEIAKNKYTNCRLISGRIVDNLTLFKEIMSGNLPFINQYPAMILNFEPKEDRPE